MSFFVLGSEIIWLNAKFLGGQRKKGQRKNLRDLLGQRKNLRDLLFRHKF